LIYQPSDFNPPFIGCLSDRQTLVLDIFAVMEMEKETRDKEEREMIWGMMSR
jgi:hypothetical protein